MEIESSGINFEDLGLPANFLQLHNIDPSFFNGLSEDIKMEIILEYLPKDDNPVQNNQPALSNEQQNLDFLNSLPLNLREEVLLTSDEACI